MKKIYTKYANIKAKIAELQTQAEDIKKQIEQDMIKNDKTKEVTDFGQFILASRSFWTYSDTLKAEVAKMQKKEQATGKAKQAVTTALTFKSN